jgi:hypothetical protein
MHAIYPVISITFSMASTYCSKYSTMLPTNFFVGSCFNGSGSISEGSGIMKPYPRPVSRKSDKRLQFLFIPVKLMSKKANVIQNFTNIEGLGVI